MCDNLSSSPHSVTSFLSHGFPLEHNSELLNEENDGTKCLSLPQFINDIKKLVKEKDFLNDCIHGRGNKENEPSLFHDEVTKKFSRLSMDKEDVKKFQFFDETKKYTRNLIATDHSTFTLILMCWNPGKESPIHDHPCDGCWMRVYEGSVEESRYKKHDCTNSLVCSSHFLHTSKNNN
jgi:hypothetical protein